MGLKVPLATAGFILLAATASADDWTQRLSLAGAYSDNVDRAQVNSRNELVYTGQLGLSYARDTRALSADIDIGYRYEGYARNTFVSHGYLGLDALTDWRIVPERLSWLFENQYGQVAFQPFGAVMPVDRQNINYLTTGPTASLPLGRSNEVNLSGLYSDTYYSETDIDSHQLTGVGQLIHHWGVAQSVSLNYLQANVQFDRPDLYSDYTITKEFVGVEGELRRMSYAIEAGVTYYKSRDTETKDRADFMAVTAYRQLGAFTLVGFDYRRGFSDSAEAFRFDERASGASARDQDVQVEASPFRERRSSAFVSLRKPKLYSELTVSYETERHNSTTNAGRRVRSTELETGLSFSARTVLSIFGSYSRFDLEDQSEKDIDLLTGVDLQYQATRNSRLNLRFERYDRNSTLVDFAENRIILAWTYDRTNTLRRRSFDPYRARGLRQPGLGRSNTVTESQPPMR